MADETLQAEFDAAVVAGDLTTLERVGPMLYPEDGASPVAPSPSADAARAPHLPATEYARRTREIRDEMLQTNMGSPRMAELQDELNGLYQQRWPEDAAEPETGPSPTSINFPDGTPDVVTATFCLLAQEEGASIGEAQAIVDGLRPARAMAPAECRAELAREWGPRLESNLALADRAFAQLPFALRDAVNALDDFGERPSPAVIKALVAWGQRPARKSWR